MRGDHDHLMTHVHVLVLCAGTELLLSGEVSIAKKGVKQASLAKPVRARVCLLPQQLRSRITLITHQHSVFQLPHRF